MTNETYHIQPHHVVNAAIFDVFHIKHNRQVFVSQQGLVRILLPQQLDGKFYHGVELLDEIQFSVDPMFLMVIEGRVEHVLRRPSIQVHLAKTDELKSEESTTR